MTSIQTLTTFFGWCTAIDFGILIMFLIFMSIIDKDGFIIQLTTKIFGTNKEDTLAAFLRAFMQFRILFVVFNVAPFIALLIMA